MSSDIADLRSALQELQSHDLPPTYRLDKENNVNANDNNNEDNTAYNPQLLQQYKTLRATYIQQATIDKFLTSLQQYNPETHTFPLPPPINDDDKQTLANKQEEVLNKIQQTMSKITGDMDGVRTKWNQFVEKRDELSQIVDQLDRQERNRRLEEGGNNVNMEDAASAMGGGDVDNGEDITEEDCALEEEKLVELQQRKLELENRLRSVRAQILDVEDDCHRTKRVVNEVRVKGGRKPLNWRGLSSIENNTDGEAGADKNNDYDMESSGGEEYISAVAEEVEAEITEMEERSAELKKSCEFYDGIRELMEELGGVKILSSKSISSAEVTSPSNSNNVNEESAEKKQRLEDGFVLTLMLLGSHILEITLSKSSTDKDGLSVSDAKITTPTTFALHDTSNNSNNNNNEDTTTLMETMHSVSLSNLSFSKIMSQKQSQEVTIPPLDDLVSFSQSLESSSHGIRFILVETMARIRTLEARVVELAQLRARYAAQVYDVEVASADNQYGGAEQEVVCAINEGITVALRLGADCPLIPGSVYVSEIFGVGGWEEEKLNELKNVVLSKRCKGPMEVMDCMVKEIRKRSQEEGWVVPATPSLPRGKYLMWRFFCAREISFTALSIP